MIYKAEGRYYLETRINRDGETWKYELNLTDVILVEDLLWIAEQVGLRYRFYKRGVIPFFIRSVKQL